MTGNSYRLQTTDTWAGFERRWATLAEATRVSPFQRIAVAHARLIVHEARIGGELRSLQHAAEAEPLAMQR